MVKSKLKGIVPRLVKSIFEFIYNSPDHLEFIVKISMLEIYLEEVKDLINPNNPKKVRIRNSPSAGVILENLCEVCVGDELEVENVMSKGLSNRTIGRTNMNEVSSRSHLITLIHVTQTDTIENNIKKGKLYLVDLAGSEKVGKTGATGTRLDEAKLINKSLFNLGSVINALTEGSSHIPYRNSTLTEILRETLGGNSKTTLVITCSPAIYNIDETISTLKFGMRAKTIKNKVKINEEISKKQLLIELEKARSRIDYLESYNDFLKSHIKNKLNAVVPPFKGGVKLQSTEEIVEEAKSSVPPEVIEEFKDQINDLEKKSSGYQTEIETLKAQLEESKEMNRKLNKKFQALMEDFKTTQRKNLELNEELLHVEETNKELMVTLDNFENEHDKREKNLDHLSSLEDNQKVLNDLITNFSSGKEKTLLTKCFENMKEELKNSESQNSKLNSIVKNLMSNYKNIVEVELPSLEANHVEIVNNIEKDSNVKNLFCNNKLINAVNKYIEEIGNNKLMLQEKDKTIAKQNNQFKEYKKKMKRVLNAMRNKVELLSKCVNICVTKIEDQNSKNLNSGQHVNVDVNFKELDDYYSNNFQSMNQRNEIINMDGNKVIKMIRGRKKGNSKIKSESEEEQEEVEID